MKNVTKTAISIFMVLAFFSMVLPVQAIGNDTKPNPLFKNNASHIDRSRRPYYGNDAVVDTYLLNGINYSTDAVSQQIVEIVPQDIQYKTDATFSQEELKGQAEKLISDFLGNNVDLSTLSFSLGKKIGTYFFRWEDNAKKLDDGTPAYIQVGLSANGDFLNLFNTLPFGNTSTISKGSNTGQPASMAVSPMIGAFNDVYANGSTIYWSGSGSFTPRTGGWYYLHPSGCSGTFCPFFYTAPGSSLGNNIGQWNARANKNTEASVFIPSTYASATVTYSVGTNGQGTIRHQVNQNAYSNSWVALNSSVVSSGISYVTLVNFAASGTSVAWDECWVYNPS